MKPSKEKDRSKECWDMCVDCGLRTAGATLQESASKLGRHKAVCPKRPVYIPTYIPKEE